MLSQDGIGKAEFSSFLSQHLIQISKDEESSTEYLTLEVSIDFNL